MFFLRRFVMGGGPPLSGADPDGICPICSRWKIPRIVRRILSQGRPSRCYHWKMAALLRTDHPVWNLMRYFTLRLRQSGGGGGGTLSALISLPFPLSSRSSAPSRNRNFETPRLFKTHGCLHDWIIIVEGAILERVLSFSFSFHHTFH